MRDFPQYINNKQDFINLSKIKEYQEQTKQKLRAIYDADDSKATRTTTLIDPANPEGGWNTEIIDNPMPVWKQKGFESREEILELIEMIDTSQMPKTIAKGI